MAAVVRGNPSPCVWTADIHPFVSVGYNRRSQQCRAHTTTTTTRVQHRYTAAAAAHHRVYALGSRAAVESTRLFSPAKINVFLRIMRRREDGFHDLASLFHVINLGDYMDVSLLPEGATEDQLTCNWDDVPLDGSNLVIKAANLFREKTGLTSVFFRVHLEKNVPHGAGMGGGSGNAATMLWAANQLCGTPASTEQLLAWSGDIGSDISVFFSQGAAYCTGRGEIVENIDPPIDLQTPLLLVKPPIGLSTPTIFKALDLDRRSTEDPKDILRGLCNDSKVLPKYVVNDLEQPAFDCLPELKQLKEDLIREGSFDAVFMTGSGSTIVGIGSDEIPSFLHQRNDDVFIQPARLLTRPENAWYTADNSSS